MFPEYDTLKNFYFIEVLLIEQMVKNPPEIPETWVPSQLKSPGRECSCSTFLPAESTWMDESGDVHKLLDKAELLSTHTHS